MSQDLDSNKPSSFKKTQDIGFVGFIGACLTSIITSFVTEPLLQKNLILGVPLFSICIVEISKWLWTVFSPQDANKFKLRRELDKKQKQIEKDLQNPNFSEEHKKALLKELEAISLDRINSYDR